MDAHVKSSHRLVLHFCEPSLRHSMRSDHGHVTFDHGHVTFEKDDSIGLGGLPGGLTASSSISDPARPPSVSSPSEYGTDGALVGGGVTGELTDGNGARHSPARQMPSDTLLHGVPSDTAVAAAHTATPASALQAPARWQSFGATQRVDSQADVHL